MRRLGSLLLLLAACGGGGGGGPLPPIEQTVILGAVRADAMTVINVNIANPLAGDATVEEVGGVGGPFVPAAGALPVDVVEGDDLTLRVEFTPPAPGTQDGEIHLKFVAGKEEREVVLILRANVETATLTLLTPTLGFPETLVGEQKTLAAQMRNDSELTPVAVTAMSGLPAEFSASFIPRTLFPGDILTVNVTYTPTAPADHNFFLSFVNSLGVPLNVNVTAGSQTWIPQQIVNFGNVPLSNGRTDWLEVDVPTDAISLSIEGVAGSSTVTPGLLAFEGPGGKVYENEQATGVFIWSPGSEGVFATTLPESDKSDVQLVPGGGLYRFRLYLFSGSASSLAVRAIVENRPGGVTNGGVLDLNVFLSPGLSITSPGTDTKLQAVLSRMDDIYAQIGLHIGDVSYYQIGDSAYDNVNNGEFPQLLAKSSAASSTRANLFFVQTALGGGVLGIAGGIPGPALDGTRVSGVMVDYDWSDATAVGQVAAHELGHYLGLYHTAESTGQHDIINDTLECPGQCTSASGGYLMHWQYDGSALPTITAGEAHVILGHPLVGPEPSLAGLSALAQKKAPPVAYVELPPNFCGTCAKHK